jgi:hypothetical protein
LILFEDFDGGETYEFSADLDPNSIAGLQQGTASIDAEWDVGGVSGAEMINSVVTVLFGDGATASGTVASDGSQAGGVAVVANNLLAAPEMLVAGKHGPDAAGSYSAAPSVVVTGTPAITVRVTMVRGFDPVDNVTPLAVGKITAENLGLGLLEGPIPDISREQCSSAPTRECCHSQFRLSRRDQLVPIHRSGCPRFHGRGHRRRRLSPFAHHQPDSPRLCWRFRGLPIRPKA